MRNFKLIFITLIIGVSILCRDQLFGQAFNKNLSEPVVGQRCPEFRFSKIDFYTKKELALSDLKGKWVVLDFWSVGCSACIASFPQISREQREFKEKLQFVLVGPDARSDDRKTYAAYHSKLNLAMPSAFDDDLFKSFNVGLLPHSIIIDPDGIVRAITTYPPKNKLEDLMNGKSVDFVPASYENNEGKQERYKYDRSKPFLINDNGGVDSSFLFRSILAKWTPASPISRDGAEGSKAEAEYHHRSVAHVQNMPCSVTELYSLAYFGSMIEKDPKDSDYKSDYWQSPIFEIEDSGILKSDKATGLNLYCYSITIPVQRCTNENIRRYMQQDLNRWFGYEVVIEERTMPYWKLTASEEAREKLKTKGGIEKMSMKDIRWGGQIFKNYPLRKFLSVIQYAADLGKSGMPIVDESGIKSNIDIEVDWLKETEAVLEALQKNGLFLLKAEKQMKVIVVRGATGNNLRSAKRLK